MAGDEERRRGDGGNSYIMAKKISFSVDCYKYLLTLLRKYYIEGGIVCILYMFNFKSLYYEKNLLDYGCSAHWVG